MMPRCQGITKAGTRCTRVWRTLDPGLKRSAWWCEQHQDQRPVHKDTPEDFWERMRATHGEDYGKGAA